MCHEAIQAYMRNVMIHSGQGSDEPESEKIF